MRRGEGEKEEEATSRSIVESKVLESKGEGRVATSTFEDRGALADGLPKKDGLKRAMLKRSRGGKG